MARYNEILVGRFARGLQKLFGIKGEVPVASLAGELVVSHMVMSGRENRYLEGWRTFGARLSVGAVAAQDTVFRFNNPSGSNTIAVVEGMKMSAGVASEVLFEFASTANGNLAGGTVTPAAFDNRDNPSGTGNNGAACGLSGTNNIGQGNHVVFDDLQLAVNVESNELINYENQEIPVPPNSDLQVRSITLNTNLVFTIRWRERFLEEAERA